MIQGLLDLSEEEIVFGHVRLLTALARRRTTAIVVREVGGAFTDGGWRVLEITVPHGAERLQEGDVGIEVLIERIDVGVIRSADSHLSRLGSLRRWWRAHDSS